MQGETTLSTLIPIELDEEFEVACARRRLKKKPAVAQALRAWVVSASSTIPPIADAPASAGAAANLQEDERRAVDLLVRILRSPKPGLARAIEQNLRQFADAAELYATSHHATNKARTDKSGEVGGVGPSKADTERVAEDIKVLRESLEEAEKVLRRLRAQVDQGQKRHARIPGKGSGD